MNDIEEEFYNTFEIEPIGCECYETSKNCVGIVDCSECARAICQPITDRILLELICILNNFSDFCIEEICYECLKEEILCKCIEWLDCAIKHDEFKAQVQSLFKGGE